MPGTVHEVGLPSGRVLVPSNSEESVESMVLALVVRHHSFTNYAFVPRPSSYPLLGPKYLLLGTIYPQLRVQGGSWLFHP